MYVCWLKSKFQNLLLLHQTRLCLSFTEKSHAPKQHSQSRRCCVQPDLKNKVSDVFSVEVHLCHEDRHYQIQYQMVCGCMEIIVIFISYVKMHFFCVKSCNWPCLISFVSPTSLRSVKNIPCSEDPLPSYHQAQHPTWPAIPLSQPCHYDCHPTRPCLPSSLACPPALPSSPASPCNKATSAS